MSILIRGIAMPKDCPMCYLAHYNKLDEFVGCEIVPGKKYAVRKDEKYANSSTRPDWCPLVPVPPHGRLIDGDIAEVIHFADEDVSGKDFYDGILYAEEFIIKQPTIIEAEGDGEV